MANHHIYGLRVIGSNQFFYVGQTPDLDRRLKTHQSEALSGKHKYLEVCRLFQTQPVEIVLLETVTQYPSKAEVKWWRQLKSSGHPLVNIEPWSHDSKSHQDYLERRKQMQDAEFSEFLNVLRSGKWIVLDTETTGVDEPEIIDLAVIDGTTEAVLFNSRFNPITPVEPEAARVNRLSPDDLLAEPRFSDKYPEIIELLKDRQIVIWNAKFDYRALIHTCKVHNLSTQFMTYNDFWCAMINYGVHTGETNYKGEPKWFKLTNAALREKIVAGPAHRALGDSITTARVMKAILACQV